MKITKENYESGSEADDMHKNTYTYALHDTINYFIMIFKYIEYCTYIELAN